MLVTVTLPSNLVHNDKGISKRFNKISKNVCGSETFINGNMKNRHFDDNSTV